MLSADALCYLAALACFLCAAFGVSARVSWRDLGYACLVLSLLL
jgi:hypothetical protein